MARPSGVAVMVILVLLSAQSMTVFGIRGMGELRPKVNSTSLATNTSSTTTTTTTTTFDLEQERMAEVGPEVLGTVEDSTSDAAAGFSAQRMQMEQSGWSCSGGFTSQQHAWYCAGRSAQ